MRRLLINITLFSLPIIACLLVIEIFLRKIPNNYTYKDDYLKENSKKLEVLYLGSSHIYFGVNPEYSKSNSFNAASISQTIDLDWQLFNKYHWQSLKAIVLPADYISMYGRLQNQKDSWRLKNYSNYYNLNTPQINNSEVLNGNFASNFSRISNYLVYKKNSIECNKYGFGNTYTYSKREDLKGTSVLRSKRHTVDVNSSTAISNFEYNSNEINKFIDYAKKHNVKVYFLSTPVSEYYYDLTNNKQLHSTFSFVENKVAENNGFCYFINLIKDKEFNNHDFFDGDHLNDLGAKKLTLKLNNLIKY